MLGMRSLRSKASYGKTAMTLTLVHNSLTAKPTDLRYCSQHAGANVDFGDEGAVDWAFLGNLKRFRALLLG